MKKILAIALVLLSVLQMTVFADTSNISVVLDGNYISFDQPPVMQNDRVLVPLRAIFEALNATVDWDDATQKIISSKGNTIVIMQIGNPTFTVNNIEKTLDVPPQIIGERTLVPVRAIAESFDCIVDWDGDNQTVIINNEIKISTRSESISPIKAENATYSAIYPVIESDSSTLSISAINSSIVETIDNHIKNAIEMRQGGSSGYNLIAYDIEYGITNTSNNLLSILYTTTETYEDGTVLIGRFADVYKLSSGEKADITDYFSTMSYEEIIAMIITNYNMIILQEPELYYLDAAEYVEIYIDDAVIYPCGKEIAVLFNPGVIAPYEMGFITMTYPAEY